MAKNLNPVYDLIRADGSIVINKNLTHAIGLNETIIYSELLSKYNYFNERSQLDEEGFFFNTVEDLQLSTSLGEKPQRAAIKELSKLGLIEYKLKGVPPKRYFKITNDVAKLIHLLEVGENNIDNLKLKMDERLDKSKLRLLGGIESANREELNPPNGRVNNTKLNNTNSNNINNGICDTDKFSSICPVVIEKYIKAYKKHKGKDHPKLSDKQVNNINYYITEIMGNDDTVLLTDWQKMIDKHFNTDYKGKTDFNANHFFTPGVLKNRYFEVVYRKPDVV